MQKTIRPNKSRPLALVGLFLIPFLLSMESCKKEPKELADFNQVNLVANNNEYGATTRVDPTFINGWGIAFSSGGTAWVSAEGSGLSEVWNSAGNVAIPAVTIPSAGDIPTGGHPSGQLFNGTTDFVLANGKPARFIFAGLDGVISGWNGGTAAVSAIDDSKSGAVYTGITLASDGGANFLYVANFSAGKIDVYDKNWAEVWKSFKDPWVPRGYSPFNIQNIGGMLYVMYAKLGPGGDEEKGAGNGYVAIFNTGGSLVKHFISRGALNAPWGVAQAPAGFFTQDMGMGNTQNAILVGNFGDGRINVYDENGRFIGPLRSKNRPLVIDGLWAISFAPVTATTINPNWLFFAAGPDDEADGLFGYITK
ncbi:MAG: TIGR03118 family protein [Ginsengibacter sp.]